MTKIRIYTTQPLTVGDTVQLEQRASQHLLRVLRAQTGDSLVVFNGQGGEYRAQLQGVSKGHANIKILDFVPVSRESPLGIQLLQGVSRGERMDYTIQKATELGIANITPLLTERCMVKLSGKRLAKRLSHWRAIIIAACEQSGRCRIPTLRPMQSLMECLSQHTGYGIVCDTEATQSIREHAALPETVSLLIGPEGGLSPQEIQQALAHGFHALSLGPRILRTETAPVVALALLQGYGGDL